jgi:transcriptional regulator with XRE-family HTH domain
LTQEQLAEKADVSTHYIAMIETCNKYPKPEMLERLAQALDVEPHRLFSVSDDPDEAIDRLHKSIVTNIQQGIIDMKQVVREAVKESLSGECKDKDKK